MTLVREAEQALREPRVGIRVQRDADPPGVRKGMVRLPLPRRDQLVPQAPGKEDIDHPVAVEVTDLAVPQVELGAPVPVDPHPHARPRRDPPGQLLKALGQSLPAEDAPHEQQRVQKLGQEGELFECPQVE